jgi:hypothetical protein
VCADRRRVPGRRITHFRRGGGPMSKIRPVRQRTDAPRQDEGPSTGAALPAAGGVYLGFAVADGRRSALLVQTGELLGFTALAALAVQRDSRACSVPAGWRTLPGTACTTGAAGPPGRGPGTRRSASATTWPSLRRCSLASSSRGPARPALRRLASRSRPGRPGPGISPEDGPQNRPCQPRADSEVSAGWSVNPPAGRRLGHAHRR